MNLPPPRKVTSSGVRSQLKLFFLAGRANPGAFDLQTDNATIGNSPKCDIWLRDPEIPTELMIFQEAGGELILRKLDPYAVVLLNGAPLTQAEISSGAVIEVGKFKMQAEVTPAFSERSGAANPKIIVDPPFMDGSLMGGRPQERRKSHIEAALGRPPKIKKTGKSYTKQVVMILLVAAVGHSLYNKPGLRESVIKTVSENASPEKITKLFNQLIAALQINTKSPQPTTAAQTGTKQGGSAVPMTTVADLLKNGPPKLPPPLPADLEANLKETDGAAVVPPTPAPAPLAPASVSDSNPRQ